MADTVRKAARLTKMLNQHPRLTVRTIQAELGLSRPTAYRWLKSISREIPITISDGVVRLVSEEAQK